MGKIAECIVLLAFCVLSMAGGLITGKAAHNPHLALFFYLLSGLFFLAMFRPRRS